MLSLKESVSELKSEKLKLESQLNQSEKALGIRSDEIDSLKSTVSQVGDIFILIILIGTLVLPGDLPLLFFILENFGQHYSCCYDLKGLLSREVRMMQISAEKICVL